MPTILYRTLHTINADDNDNDDDSQKGNANRIGYSNAQENREMCYGEKGGEEGRGGNKNQTWETSMELSNG